MVNFNQNIKDIKVLEVVRSAAERLDYPVYLVGGYVRDLVINKTSKDMDLVCVGSGIKLAREVAKLCDKPTKVNVFKNFGTAMLTYNGYELEFVGARKESYRKDSRKPIVEDGTLDDDLRRRDFTINTMAVSLNPEDYGDLLDPFMGIQDIHKKIIRTPLDPEITFSDDPLRMMRAIRFAAQLQFDIEADTFQAITNNASRLKIVSTERITEELNKIILADQPSYGFKLLFHSGLLQVFFPELAKLHGVDKRDHKAHKDNFYHTLKVLDNISFYTNNLWLRWAALLHDIAKPATKRFDPKVGWTFHGHEDKGAKMVQGIFKQLRLPLNGKMKYVRKLVRLHLRPIALVNEQVTDSAIRRLIYDAGDDLEDLMTLCRADITSKNHQKVKRYLKNFEKVEQRAKEVEESDQIRNFQPVVTGDMIMKTFGIPPSPAVGELKEALKEAVLDGKIKNEYQPAMDFIMQLGRQKGLLAPDR